MEMIIIVIIIIIIIIIIEMHLNLKMCVWLMFLSCWYFVCAVKFLMYLHQNQDLVVIWKLLNIQWPLLLTWFSFNANMDE